MVAFILADADSGQKALFGLLASLFHPWEPDMTAAGSPPVRLGFWLESDSHQACEIARLAGYDFVVFDMEHGTVAESALDRLIPFCRAIGLAAHVRVSEPSRPHIQHALDMGADAVILPQIGSLDHAGQSASFAKYPPLGTRGMGFGRTHAYGAAETAFIAAENARARCYAMIETPGALDEAEAIAALGCVDGLFVGPSDLSLTRGRGMFSAGGADLDDLQRIARAAHGAGKPWGAAAANPSYRRAAVDQGASFVTVADDLSALVAGFASLLQDAKE